MNLILDGLPDTVTVSGREIPIQTDFRTGIIYEQMLQDPDMDPVDKLFTALEMYFPGENFRDPDEAREAIERIIWFYRCGDEQPVKSDGEEDSLPAEQSFSYEYDADYIYAAFLSTYRIDLARENLHWWQFHALFRALPDDTQIMKIIGYRTMKIPEGCSKETRRHYEHLKEIYRLPESADIQQLESDLTSLLMNGGNPSELLK